jgi:hypothetical protein
MQVSVAAGGAFTCFVTTAQGGGAVNCAGLNDVGQLGDGTETDSPAAVRVVGCIVFLFLGRVIFS